MIVTSRKEAIKLGALIFDPDNDMLKMEKVYDWLEDNGFDFSNRAANFMSNQDVYLVLPGKWDECGKRRYAHDIVFSYKEREFRKVFDDYPDMPIITADDFLGIDATATEVEPIDLFALIGC